MKKYKGADLNVAYLSHFSNPFIASAARQSVGFFGACAIAALRSL
jgi:hypothetical protein